MEDMQHPSLQKSTRKNNITRSAQANSMIVSFCDCLGKYTMIYGLFNSH